LELNAAGNKSTACYSAEVSATITRSSENAAVAIYQQWRSQPNFFRGPKCFTLGEKQYFRKRLFFLLLMLLFRSVCHQSSNQADKLVLLAIFIIS